MKLFFYVNNVNLTKAESLVKDSKRQLLKLKKIGSKQFLISFVNAQGIFSIIKTFDGCVVGNKFFFLTASAFLSFYSLLKSYLRSFNTGYFFEFIIRGIGYRYKFYKKQGKVYLSFRLGYSHRILFPFISSVKLLMNKRFDFIIFSFYKMYLKDYGEQLRFIRSVDSYKGKGIKYYDQPLRLKVGKVR